MAADFVDVVGDVQDIAFGASTCTVAVNYAQSGRSLVFTHNNLRDVTSVTSHGVACTELVSSANGRGGWWISNSDVSGAGNVVVTCADTIGVIAVVAGCLTGSDNTMSDSAEHEADQADPQTNTGIDIPSNGIAVSALATFSMAQNANPTTWGNTTRIVAAEDHVATGNSVAGAKRTTTGTNITIEASGGGGGNGWGFSGQLYMATVVFGASGGGGNIATFQMGYP